MEKVSSVGAAAGGVRPPPAGLKELPPYGQELQDRFGPLWGKIDAAAVALVRVVDLVALLRNRGSVPIAAELGAEVAAKLEASPPTLLALVPGGYAKPVPPDRDFLWADGPRVVVLNFAPDPVPIQFVPPDPRAPGVCSVDPGAAAHLIEAGCAVRHPPERFGQAGALRFACEQLRGLTSFVGSEALQRLAIPEADAVALFRALPPWPSEGAKDAEGCAAILALWEEWGGESGHATKKLADHYGKNARTVRDLLKAARDDRDKPVGEPPTQPSPFSVIGVKDGKKVARK